MNPKHDFKFKFRVLIPVVLLFTCCKNMNNNYQAHPGKHVSEIQSRNGDDPWLVETYMNLNTSPMQEKLRNIRPFPVGVVYYQQRDHNFDSVVSEFKTIQQLGFTALKQIQLVAPYNPEEFESTVFNAALDVGISPWYYGKGGWAPITPDLLNELEIGFDYSFDNMKKVQNHPNMIKYQNNIMRERISKMGQKPPRPEGMGEPGRNNPWMPERLVPYFATWLENEYLTIENLKYAWNCGFCGNCNFNTFFEAAQLMQGTGFDQFGNGTGKTHKDFRRFRDAMKFQSELIVKNYREVMELYTRWDSLEPERTGGHQIFENQAVNTWDLEGQARTASIGGSFYASIHLCHHFFLVDGEITRPVYMQSRIVADMFKGGWAATWESTGGPTFHSGYNPVTVNAGTMRHLMLQYIAAGLKGIGFWMWNSRGEGWEVGEYALCDIQGKPSDRAIEAGKISKIIQDQRFELWESMDEPVVGILYSWENEAILGRMSLGAYPLNIEVYETDWDKQFRQYHSEAKIGISRTLMNDNIPFEYLTEHDLENGLANRYPIIYLPSVIALDNTHFSILKEYVSQGGHLISDMPFMLLDNYGRLNKQYLNETFEQLTGFQTSDLFHTKNQSKKLDGIKITGYFGNLKVSQAKVIKTFDDGAPAIIQHNFGSGKFTLLNFEAGRLTFRPDNKDIEKIIASVITHEIIPPFEVNNAVNSYVLRRSAPFADHYFIINEGSAETIEIKFNDVAYTEVTDLIDSLPVIMKKNVMCISSPGKSGKWIRCVKLSN